MNVLGEDKIAFTFVITRKISKSKFNAVANKNIDAISALDQRCKKKIPRNIANFSVEQYPVFLCLIENDRLENLQQSFTFAVELNTVVTTRRKILTTKGKNCNILEDFIGKLVETAVFIPVIIEFLSCRRINCAFVNHI